MGSASEQRLPLPLNTEVHHPLTSLLDSSEFRTGLSVHSFKRASLKSDCQQAHLMAKRPLEGSLEQTECAKVWSETLSFTLKFN